MIRDEELGWVDQSREVDQGVCLAVTDIVDSDTAVPGRSPGCEQDEGFPLSTVVHDYGPRLE